MQARRAPDYAFPGAGYNDFDIILLRSLPLAPFAVPDCAVSITLIDIARADWRLADR